MGFDSFHFAGDRRTLRALAAFVLSVPLVFAWSQEFPNSDDFGFPMDDSQGIQESAPLGNTDSAFDPVSEAPEDVFGLEPATAGDPNLITPGEIPLEPSIQDSNFGEMDQFPMEDFGAGAELAPSFESDDILYEGLDGEISPAVDVSNSPSQVEETPLFTGESALSEFDMGEDGGLFDSQPFAIGRLSFRTGDLVVRSALSLGSEYNDNFNGSQNNKEAQTSVFLRPSIFIGYGEYADKSRSSVRLLYVPRANYYLGNTSQNRIDQTFRLSAKAVFSRLRLTGEIGYTSTDGVDSDIGGRVPENRVFGALSASYAAFPKVSVRAATFFRSNSYGDSGSSNLTIGVSGAVDYALQPKMLVGFGGSLGVTTVENSGEQPFQTLFLNASYDTFSKLKFFSRTGVEVRQYNDDSDRGQRLAPSIGMGVRYEAGPFTDISLNFDSRLTNSGVGGQSTYTNTALGFSIQQQLWDRLSLSMAAVVSNSSYGSSPGQNSGRSDNQVVFRQAAQIRIRGGYYAGIFYQYRQNISNLENRSFEQNILGADFSIKF